MTWKPTDLDKDELLIRKLLKGKVGSAEAASILEYTFTPFVEWSFEDVTDHLIEVFNFSTNEVDILMTKYPIHIPVKREKTGPPASFPSFKRNSKRAKEHAQNYWEARKLLNETRKLLNTLEMFQTDYENEEEFKKARSEKLNVNAAFLDISKHIEEHMNNAYSHIRGKE